jgi:dihydropteroate synthase
LAVLITRGGSARARVMGILNVTPDSFSDGGNYQSLEFAISHAEQMIEAASTSSTSAANRPARLAAGVAEEELQRVMPVLYACATWARPSRSIPTSHR